MRPYKSRLGHRFGEQRLSRRDIYAPERAYILTLDKGAKRLLSGDFSTHTPPPHPGGVDCQSISEKISNVLIKLYFFITIVPLKTFFIKFALSGSPKGENDNFLIKGVIEILSSNHKLGGLKFHEDKIGNSTCIGS